MKKILISGLLLLCCWCTTNAQVSFSLNIGTQPAWGPTGYDYADYYYLPDADAYYDINARLFWFNDGGRWISGPSLPGRYGNIDLYRTHKVVINHVSRPWIHNDRYHRRYASYRGRYDQTPIRDANDRKYWQNPGHPHYNEWQRDHGNDHDNGNHYGHDRGRGDNHDHDHGRGHDNDHGHRRH